MHALASTRHGSPNDGRKFRLHALSGTALQIEVNQDTGAIRKTGDTRGPHMAVSHFATCAGAQHLHHDRAASTTSRSASSAVHLREALLAPDRLVEGDDRRVAIAEVVATGRRQVLFIEELPAVDH